METNKKQTKVKTFLRNAAIGGAIISLSAMASGCGNNYKSEQKTARNFGISITRIQKIEKHPFSASCKQLIKAARFNMQRAEMFDAINLDNSNLTTVNISSTDSAFSARAAEAAALTNVYLIKGCNKKKTKQ
ncbi:MAG: hypothetical protein M1331_02320 [Candidatus Marsarchaeota archaeon]|nr:hypothetical protein [Candidatus Marsarchaeota archaeon]MCL5106206.1 hypothetical protein [Candidatus Marsarchaeota archaeon]